MTIENTVSSDIDLRSSVVNSVFDCRLPGVKTGPLRSMLSPGYRHDRALETEFQLTGKIMEKICLLSYRVITHSCWHLECDREHQNRQTGKQNIEVQTYREQKAYYTFLLSNHDNTLTMTVHHSPFEGQLSDEALIKVSGGSDWSTFLTSTVVLNFPSSVPWPIFCAWFMP